MIFIMTNFCFKKKYSKCTLPEGCHPLDPNHWCLGVQLWPFPLFSHATECKRKKGLQLKSWAPWCYFKLKLGQESETSSNSSATMVCDFGKSFLSLWASGYPLGLQILVSTLSQKSLEIWDSNINLIWKLSLREKLGFNQAAGQSWLLTSWQKFKPLDPRELLLITYYKYTFKK